MVKEKNAAALPLYRELFQLGIYKRSQGRIARQATFAVLVIVVLLAAWRVSELGRNINHVVQFGVPAAIGLIGVWFAFRLVNLSSFADFLIAVEAEMNKVSWPTRPELVRSSIVVILLIVFLAAVLYGFDIFWRSLLSLLQVLQ